MRPSSFFDRITFPVDEVLERVPLPSGIEDPLNSVEFFSASRYSRVRRRSDGPLRVSVRNEFFEKGDVKDRVNLH